MTGTYAKGIASYKIRSGSRPSNTMMLDRLTSNTLGQLIAPYEHKVFVKRAIWGINCSTSRASDSANDRRNRSESLLPMKANTRAKTIRHAVCWPRVKQLKTYALQTFDINFE